MCSCGFDADVVRTLHTQRTGHVNSASYFNPIMASIRHYDYPELRIYWNECGAGVPPALPGPEPPETPKETVTQDQFDGRPLALRLQHAVLRGRLADRPEASESDGLLDVCTFRHGGFLHGLYYAAAVLTGTHQWLTDFAIRRSGGFRVTSDAKVPYQLDGDPGGFLPVEIAIVRDRLTLVVPVERVVGGHLQQEKEIALNPVTIGPYCCGRGQRLLVIAGPCVIENRGADALASPPP